MKVQSLRSEKVLPPALSRHDNNVVLHTRGPGGVSDVDRRKIVVTRAEGGEKEGFDVRGGV